MTPTLADQIHGGVAQVAGQIQGEQIVYERGTSSLLSDSFMDYITPAADKICAMKIVSSPVPTPTNPLAAKGSGEAGCVGALPAVVIAIMNALANVGERELVIPATSDRLWRTVQAASKTPKGA